MMETIEGIAKFEILLDFYLYQKNLPNYALWVVAINQFSQELQQLPFSIAYLKNVSIWGYFETGRCKICSAQEQRFWAKTHFYIQIPIFTVGIFEICAHIDFMTI